jgi:hypothetical protein
MQRVSNQEKKRLNVNGDDTLRKMGRWNGLRPTQRRIYDSFDFWFFCGSFSLKLFQPRGLSCTVTSSDESQQSLFFTSELLYVWLLLSDFS